MADGRLKIAVIRWSDTWDEISRAIGHELGMLGHTVAFFGPQEHIPQHVDVVFLFAPYGEIVPRLEEAALLTPRPTVVHWNTEGFPDLRIPLPLTLILSSARSWVGRNLLGDRRFLGSIGSRMNRRILRFRYVGDYHFAWRRGLLDVYADSSEVYARLYRSRGIPVVVAPWGSVPAWYEDLKLNRDIDVLWMGKRGASRRSRLLDRIRTELSNEGVEVHMVDSEENPFVFGRERTILLNRAKITLNITRTWYDDNFSRFAIAAPNRSLIVSEPLLDHCPEFQPNVHYISSPVSEISSSILYYIKNERERSEIVEKAYELVTSRLTFHRSIERIMAAVGEHRSGARL